MAKTIAINGTKLDQIQMPLEQSGSGHVSFSSYRENQFNLSRNDDCLRLVIPTPLAVELYRIGILPQDAHLPLEVSLSGRTAGWFIVTDMRHVFDAVGPAQVKFTLMRVPQVPAHDAATTLQATHSVPAAEGTYVTDITHYLDEAGELMPLPGPARKLASFLVLVIEAATIAEVGDDHATGIRCRKKSCPGTIRTLLLPDDHEIFWRCPVCEHHGVIRNWQNTKWNQLKGTEESR